MSSLGTIISNLGTSIKTITKGSTYSYTLSDLVYDNSALDIIGIQPADDTAKLFLFVNEIAYNDFGNVDLIASASIEIIALLGQTKRVDDTLTNRQAILNLARDIISGVNVYLKASGDTWLAEDTVRQRIMRAENTVTIQTEFLLKYTEPTGV